MNWALLGSLIAILLTSCGSAAFYASNGQGAEIAAIAPGLLAKQTLKDVEITSPSGVKMRIGAYASRMPDPAVTDLGKSYVLWNNPITRATGVSLVKGTEDVTKTTLGAQGVQKAKISSDTVIQQGAQVNDALKIRQPK